MPQSFNNKKNKGFTKTIALFYFLIVLIGAFLLYTNFAQNQNVTLSFVDALFLSTSSFSDTGLTPVNFNDTFNIYGQIIIVILMQVGAIGIMSVKVLLFVIIGRKINTSDRMLIHTEQGQTGFAGMVKFIKSSIILLFIVQIFFTIVTTIHMIYFYDYNFLESLWFSYFHVTSAITNSGIDLLDNSLTSFAHDYAFQIYMMILIVFGGVGFGVLVDIKHYLNKRKENKKHLFSLFSKISLTTYFIVSLVGLVLIMIIDFNYIFIESNGVDGFFYTLFHVISSRSAGYSTTDITSFSQGSQLVLAILMFIGAAPASTGGGIRTTTAALIVLYLYSYAHNKKDVEAFKRRISPQTVTKAFVSFIIAIFMVVISLITIVSLEKDLSMLAVFFEVCSAFGTTGLSTGITAQLSFFSKIIIIFLMIIGQIGIVNSLMLLGKNMEKENKVRYPEENIAIG